MTTVRATDAAGDCDDTDRDDAASQDAWLVRHPVLAGGIFIAFTSLAIRYALVKDGYFITDDFMLSTRAMEHPLGWDYLTRVHTGHFEPVGFGFMWLFAHIAPLNWSVAVLALIASQAGVAILVWRLLVELFGSRLMILVPFALYCFSPLTAPAFTWLSAAIIWVPLTAAIAGSLRQHTRFLRTGNIKNAIGAGLWLLLGMASFEKILIYLPFVVFFSVLITPRLAVRVRDLWEFAWRTRAVWLIYIGCTLAYLAAYVPASRQSDAASVLALPTLAQFGDFAYKTVLQTFVPGAFGGPWEWTPVSYATAIVSSPRAFDWACWIIGLALVLLSIVIRKRAGRAWAALTVYLVGSILSLGLSRVPIIGSVAGLETRYIADAVVPFVVVVGFCLMPLRNETRPWTSSATTIRTLVPTHAARTACTILPLTAIIVLSLHALNAYAAFHVANPYRSFTENARRTFQSLPSDAQVYDTGLPVDVVGPLFLNYNLVSRFLAPFATQPQREQMYTRTFYTNPYFMGKDGRLIPMTVAGVGSPAPLAGFCGWATKDGRVSVPLTAPVFAWSWAVRVGYISDGPTPIIVNFGTGEKSVQLHDGLGEVFLPITGGGSSVDFEGADPNTKVCITDVQVGSPVPKK